MRVTILGAGNMGSAISVVLSDNGHDVRFWSIEPDVVDDINTNHVNSKYLSGVSLRARAFSEIEEALAGAELVVFAVPSHVLRSVCETAKGLIPEAVPIVNLGKGYKLSEVIKEFFPNPLVIVGGPCIATELAKKVPSFVVFAGEADVRSVFENDYYHVSTSRDVRGVELCSFLKNILAILAGFCDGKGFGVNTKAGLITNGLAELSLIAEVLGAERETIYGLAGLGDLVVTSLSEHSRNRRFGELLGKGVPKEEAIKQVGQVVEGVKAVETALKIINEKTLDCPLIRKVKGVIEGSVLDL